MTQPNTPSAEDAEAAVLACFEHFGSRDIERSRYGGFFRSGYLAGLAAGRGEARNDVRMGDDFGDDPVAVVVALKAQLTAAQAERDEALRNEQSSASAYAKAQESSEASRLRAVYLELELRAAGDAFAGGTTEGGVFWREKASDRIRQALTPSQPGQEGGG